MRIAWITDLHLNHCSLPAWERLTDQVAKSVCDAILITGDISEGEDVVFQLNRLADAVARPIYFVLGNHDFYHSSLARTRAAVSVATAEHPLLHYLREQPLIELSSSVVLIGEDGWGDATEGDYEHSIVRLNDFQLIDDFHLSPPSNWQRQLQSLGQDAADRARTKLNEACNRYAAVLVATHVPPFREACWYEGHTTDDQWAPFFVCGQVGKVLSDMALMYPQTIIEVLCGHTHHGGVARIHPNLTVTTGGAVYGSPELTRLFEISDRGFSSNIDQEK